MLFTVDRIPADLHLPPSVISELFGFRNLSLSDFFPPVFNTTFNGLSHNCSQKHVRISQSEAEELRNKCLAGLVKWKLIVPFVHMKCFNFRSAIIHLFVKGFSF